MARQCPSDYNPNLRASQNINPALFAGNCYLCKQAGHMANVCPLKDQNPNQHSNSVPSSDKRMDKKQLLNLIAGEIGLKDFTISMPVLETPPRTLPDDVYKNAICPSSDECYSDPTPEQKISSDPTGVVK